MVTTKHWHTEYSVLFVAILIFNSASAMGQKPKEAASTEILPGAPAWLRNYDFPKKDFTFVRVQFTSVRDRLAPGQGAQGAAQHGTWSTDWPDADKNLSAQIRQNTNLNVASDGIPLRLTNPELAKYPFIYMVEPGSLSLNDEEATSLRQYLLDGGFLMVDDFWGDVEKKSFDAKMKRVFPGRDSIQLALDHTVFHCVFDFKEKPQVPSIYDALSPRQASLPQVSYEGIFDDKGRMMVIICHNTDLGDGWERANDDVRYRQEFSIKKAFPMAINIVFFALTQQQSKP